MPDHTSKMANIQVSNCGSTGLPETGYVLNLLTVIG